MAFREGQSLERVWEGAHELGPKPRQTEVARHGASPLGALLEDLDRVGVELDVVLDEDEIAERDRGRVPVADGTR